MNEEKQQIEVGDEKAVPVPRVVFRKRIWRWGVLGLVLVVVAGIGLWLLKGERGGGGDAQQDQPQLPLAIDQVPAESGLLEPIQVGVELAYTRTPDLEIDIRSAKQTTDRTTAEFYAPQSDEVEYFRLQLLDDSGEVAEEVPFTVPSSFIVEFGPLEGGQALPAQEGTLYIVLPVDSSAQEITAVRIVSQHEEDEFDRLDVDITLGQNDEVWRDLLGKEALAQAAPDGVFTVLILNEAGAEGLAAAALQQAQALATIRPWSILSGEGRLRFVMVPNSTPLGCTLETIPGRPETFPVCRDQARVFQTANALRPDWDTIIVPMNASCGTCGTSFLGSNVVAIGNQPLTYTMAHELGHSIAHLRDEYGYSVPGYPPQPGPPINCFPSQAACQQAIAPYAGQPLAACAPGCEQVGQWRPATAIMHTFGAPQYGPLEQANVHAAILGRLTPQTPEAPPPPPPPPVETAPPSSPRPETGEPAAEGGENIGVLMRLTSEPQLRLTIEEAELTNGQVTEELYRPRDGEPYSLLQLLGPDGTTPIVEVPFTMPTHAIGEGPSEDLVSIPVPETTAYLVIPRPQAGVSGVRVVAPSNQGIIDVEQFVAPPIRDVLRPVSWLQKPGTVLKKVWEAMTDAVWAAGTFDILVINERGASSHLRTAISATQQMLTIDPWSAFLGKVRVVGETNRVDLGCETVQIGSGSYPSCPDSGKIIQVANQLHNEWDAIVVVTDLSSQAGTVLSPRITAVGSGVTNFLLVHELGHAVGGMVDEYGYKFDNFPIQGGINCFDTVSECRKALDPFDGEPGGECSQGCTQPGEWRPATRIMHNTYNILEFGPLERCFMYNAIAEVIGVDTLDCESSDDDSNKVNDTEFYWGWRR